MAFVEGNSRVERFTVKLIEKWSEKAVVWTIETLSLLDLVKVNSRVCP